jgi:hypothetical protein
MVGQANRARSEAPVQARRVMPSRAQTRTFSSLSFKLAAARRSAPPRCNDLLCLLQFNPPRACDEKYIGP